MQKSILFSLTVVTALCFLTVSVPVHAAQAAELTADVLESRAGKKTQESKLYVFHLGEGMSMELGNIKQGPVDPAIFAVPESYTLKKQ